MIHRLLLVVFFVSLLGALTSTLQAEIVVAWDIAGVDVDDGVKVGAQPTSYAFDAGTTHSNASGTLTLGSVNPTTSSDQYGFKISGSDQQTTLAGAIANDHFIQFSITVDSGYVLNLSNLTFFGETSSSGADDIALMSSIDGYSDGDQIASLSNRGFVLAGDWDSDDSGFGGPIDLSEARYQNLTGTVSFRVYGFNTSSGAGITYFRDLANRNDLVVNGTIVLAAIPEPTTLLMFGAALVGMGARRRRS